MFLVATPNRGCEDLCKQLWCSKEGILAYINIFVWYNASSINLYATYLKGSIAYGPSWGAVFHGLSSANGMIWCLIICNGPLKKQVIWDAMQDFARIKRIWALTNLEKSPDVAYHDILNKFDSTWAVKGLIVTCINLVVTWKVRPHMGIISWFPPGVHWFSQGSCVFIMFLQLIFQFAPKRKQYLWCLSCNKALYSKINNSIATYTNVNRKWECVSIDFISLSLPLLRAILQFLFVWYIKEYDSFDGHITSDR